jgi:hypothetical protein
MFPNGISPISIQAPPLSVSCNLLTAIARDGRKLPSEKMIVKTAKIALSVENISRKRIRYTGHNQA